MMAWNDLSVEFIVRDRGDAPSGHAAALADALAIGRVVYQAEEPRPLHVTILGVAWDRSPTTSAVPVLYASLPADQSVGLDWAHAGAGDLPSLAGVRWLPTGVCRAWRECGASGEATASR